MDFKAFSDKPNQKEPIHEADKKKNQAAVELGRMGGLKGGKARALKLSAEQRKEIARKAADARWQSNLNNEEKK